MAALFWFSLVWLAVGAVIGALAVAARLDRARSAGGASRSWRSRMWVKIALGAVTALIGGWLGVLVFGRLFGTASALWVSALCVVALPWLAQRPWRRAPKAGDASHPLT